MSGYGSKAEVVQVVKDTITSDHNKTGLSRDPSDYYITAIVRENFYSAAPYGWRCSTGPDEFVASLRRNLRRRATLHVDVDCVYRRA